MAAMAGCAGAWAAAPATVLVQALGSVARKPGRLLLLSARTIRDVGRATRNPVMAAVGSELRRGLALVSTLAEQEGLLAQLDPEAPFPVHELGAPRGRQGGPRRSVALP